MSQTYMPEVIAPAKGTRPEGAKSEADFSRHVREMFTQIAPRYDLLNHLLSMQLDRLWRARVAERLRPVLGHSETSVLDLCCGTGDLAITLAARYRTRMLGADFAHPMLVRARQKSASLHGKTVAQLRPIRFIEADALNLPFADASFDVVTTAFGFRNLANYEAGLAEIQRVLKPGGTVAILEFTEPPAGFLANLYRWYFQEILPRIGGFLSGDRSAYTYLPESVSRFLRPAELASLMTKVGYQSIDFRVWTLGTVVLHTGVKRA
jgi:demethylmenaquinone methyltransferase/2-methoxy-6-polyprenyl-1,4-benzoquinol methylase